MARESPTSLPDRDNTHVCCPALARVKGLCFQLDRTRRPTQCYVFRRRGPLMRSSTLNGGAIRRLPLPLFMPLNGGGLIRLPAPPLKSLVPLIHFAISEDLLF
jgi:hypothetical protein